MRSRNELSSLAEVSLYALLCVLWRLFFDCLTFEDGVPEMPVTTDQPTPPNIPQERRPRRHGTWSKPEIHGCQLWQAAVVHEMWFGIHLIICNKVDAKFAEVEIGACRKLAKSRATLNVMSQVPLCACWDYSRYHRLSTLIRGVGGISGTATGALLWIRSGSTFLSSALRFPKERCFFWGSQASPVCPSVKSNMQTKVSIQHWWLHIIPPVLRTNLKPKFYLNIQSVPRSKHTTSPL